MRWWLLCSFLGCATAPHALSTDPVRPWLGAYRHGADCLELTEERGSTRVVLSSTQPTGRCDLSERAEGVRFPLVLDDVTLDPGRGVRIEAADEALVVVVRQLASDGSAPFCQRGGTLEGLRFTADDRIAGHCTTSH